MILAVEFRSIDMDLNIQFDDSCMSFGANFSDDDLVEIETDFSELTYVTEYIGGDPYQGKYEVIPTVEEQILQTKEKVLADDIKILEIPYYDVSNTAGGSTVYIGRSLE